MSLFDTDSVAGLDRPWSDRRQCAFPLVLPGAVFCFRGERVTSSKDALYLGSPARSTTSQRALGAVTGARPSHSHCGSIPPLAVPGVPAHNNLGARAALTAPRRVWRSSASLGPGLPRDLIPFSAVWLCLPNQIL